jgi:nicotinamidase-related amidase
VRALGDQVFVQGSAFTEFHPDAVSAEEDVIVTKRRNSALSGTDLEAVLRSLGVEHLALAGVMTSGVVLSTVRQATDLDYQLTVVEDLCLGINAGVQEVLMMKIFPLQANVVSSERFRDGLKG